MKLLYITILIFIFDTSNCNFYTNLRKSIQSFIQRTRQNDSAHFIEPTVERRELTQFIKRQKDKSDTRKALDKAKILKRVRTYEQRLNNGHDIPLLTGYHKNHKQYYHMDPVLNQLNKQRRVQNARRKADSTSLESSSFEMEDWKDEFNDYWIQKKFEAVNSTDIRGDVVNMAAARPWGVPCGDPNQHDVPWGTCMLPMECDAEYRIYRGDYFCGNTQFVCCALELSTYDLNQGFDISFADSSLETDTEEKKARDRGSKENQKRKKRHKQRRRQKERRRRKTKIKKSIKRIVREIRKILNRSYRNTTQHRKKRTRQLKKYIKDLKKQYLDDRKTVREINREDMVKIDKALQDRLNEIRDLNANFLKNTTFRDIIMNGAMTKSGARMLIEAYPDLTEFLRSKIRRTGGGVADGGKTKEDDKYLQYDIEYGALYY